MALMSAPYIVYDECLYQFPGFFEKSITQCTITTPYMVYGKCPYKIPYPVPYGCHDV